MTTGRETEMTPFPHPPVLSPRLDRAWIVKGSDMSIATVYNEDGEPIGTETVYEDTFDPFLDDPFLVDYWWDEGDRDDRDDVIVEDYEEVGLVGGAGIDVHTFPMRETGGQG